MRKKTFGKILAFPGVRYQSCCCAARPLRIAALSLALRLGSHFYQRKPIVWHILCYCGTILRTPQRVNSPLPHAPCFCTFPKKPGRAVWETCQRYVRLACPVNVFVDALLQQREVRHQVVCQAAPTSRWQSRLLCDRLEAEGLEQSAEVILLSYALEMRRHKWEIHFGFINFCKCDSFSQGFSKRFLCFISDSVHVSLDTPKSPFLKNSMSANHRRRFGQNVSGARTCALLLPLTFTQAQPFKPEVTRPKGNWLARSLPFYRLCCAGSVNFRI